MCDKKWILYNNHQWPALVGLRRSSKANLHQKKVMVTVWWSAAHLINSCFLNPSKTIASEKYAQQVDEMHQKLQHLKPVLINRMGPILLHNNAQIHVVQPMLQKLNESDYEVLPHLLYSPDLLPTDCYISATFGRENVTIPSRRQKTLSKSLLNPEA